ncbi:MAG: tetratricopeptide repeat protein [Bacteroidetes bacterium]|uniref:Tetratricopeptide repeat protein n=1 Tax=Candidatus Cryptobacteroides intestinavium TaxID=2840766 RepID=A0A9D9ERT9_9BACT|nr:tetratricopeptide repeat protein [Candidatus Cryptobacteroides intestinavium]
MKNTFLIYIVCAVLPLLAVQRSGAQSFKAERALENQIIDAVSDFDAGRYAEAKERLETLVAVDPDNDAAYYYLGMTALMQNDLELAETGFETAVQLDSSNFWYRHRLAGVYAMTDRKELTVEIYNGLLKDFPKKSDLYYSLIELYLSMGRMEDALSTLDQIDTVFGRSDVSVMTRFDILRRLGRMEEAYQVLEAYNREYSSPQVLAMLGDYRMSMYEDSTALTYYDEALDIAPDYAPALLGKAEVFRITRRYEDYFRTIDVFIKDKDIPAEDKCDYLKALVQHSDPNFLTRFQPSLDSVMTSFRSVHPGDSLVTALAGIYYYGTGRMDKAKDCFRENVEQWPESLGAAANYAEALMYMGEWEELSAYTKDAYGRFPDELAFLEMSTLADYNLKAYDDVIATCSRIISVAPDDSARVLTAYTTLGDIYYHLGEKAKAYRSYDEALKVNPEYLTVLNNYAYFLSLDGRKLKKAYSMSRITVEKEPDNATYLDTFGWILYLQGRSEEAKPYFKHAMLYGGKESAVTMDHYAEVLFDLKEYSLAFVYWNQALAKDTEGEIPGLEEKIRQRKAEMNRDRK